MKPVLATDAKATEHILHRQGVGRLKHIDVAYLWWQDEVKIQAVANAKSGKGDSITCWTCGRAGHVAAVCPRSGNKNLYIDEEENGRSTSQ